MTDTTANLALPYIMAAQAQKHITHNEAIRALDCLVQLSVADRDLGAPPALPVEGARYLVAPAPTAAWAGKGGQIAAFQDATWSFHVPKAGWRCWVADEGLLLVFDGALWRDAAAESLNPASLVGVNATADATNRLTVSSAASLFNHAGAGHQIKINKSAAGQTASQLFQSSFSGRAEIGLTGDDNLHVKVSADGTTWREALVITAATGTPRVPALAKASLPAASTAAAGALIFVSDEAGGAVLAFSDGAVWRRVTDRAAVA
jgi:hypothetical protein